MKYENDDRILLIPYHEKIMGSLTSQVDTDLKLDIAVICE